MLYGSVVDVRWTCSLSAKELGLFLDKEKLLGTEDTARSFNSNPANELFRWDLISLHGKETYQGACTAKASFTMDSDSTWVR